MTFAGTGLHVEEHGQEEQRPSVWETGEMGRHSKTLEELGTCDVLRVDDEELGDSKGFADMEVRENIFPEGVESELPLQESALLPLLFLFGLVCFEVFLTKSSNL